MTHSIIENEIIILNKYLGYFFFFIAWPCINIGLSITFIIFFIILFKFSSVAKNIFIIKDKIEILIIAFLFYIFINFAFLNLFDLQDGDLYLLIQWVYWITLTLFFYKNINIIKWELVSKFAFWGSFLFTLNLFFFNSDYPIPFTNFQVGRNAYIYNQLALLPLNALYVFSKIKRKFYLSLFLILYCYIILITGGRAGSIIIILEAILVYSFLVNKVNRLVLIVILILITLQFFIFQLNQDEKTKTLIAKNIGIISPRLETLILEIGKEETLSNDESWLIRKIMIQKGLLIFNSHPFMGIGINRFSKEKVDIKSIIQNIKFNFVRRTISNPESLNSVSAHNSYLLILTELGIYGLFFIIFIIIIIIFNFIKIFTEFKKSYNMYFAISVICIITHLYVTSNIVGSVTWIMLGLGLPSLLKKN